jgi:hypothetical protein
MALEDGADELKIFENVYSRFETKQKKHWIYSPTVACVIAAVMVLALLIVFYTIDLKSPKSIMERVEAPTAEAKTDLDTLVQRQKLIRMVARERPDILALLKLINDSGERGVLLNGVSFNKDQKVSINGQVGSSEQLYKYQENLNKQKDITEVKITNIGRVSSKSGGGPSPSGRPGGPPGRPPSGAAGGKGGITFTMTFHYKNFTKKTARAQS